MNNVKPLVLEHLSFEVMQKVLNYGPDAGIVKFCIGYYGFTCHILEDFEDSAVIIMDCDQRIDTVRLQELVNQTIRNYLRAF